jgi:hypothetical protein
MSTRCTICTHPARPAIEDALVGKGVSLRRLADQWSTSKASLIRHRDRHLRPLGARQQHAGVEDATGILQREIAVLKKDVAALRRASRDRVAELEIRMGVLEDVLLPQLAQQQAQAEALAAYTDALDAYTKLCQRPMPGYEGWKDTLMQVHRRTIEQRYQVCLAVGLHPCPP